MPHRIDVPTETLIAQHAENIGGYADSFMTRVPGAVTLTEYVTAFYTTPIFRTERLLLRLAGRPSTDAEARAVAQGTTDRFAIWIDPIRTENELLMQEASGATASWFMVKPEDDQTALYFGSTVRPKSGEKDMPAIFKALSGFHNLYSHLLLASAARRLTRK